MALPAVANKKPSREEAEPSLRTHMSNKIAERHRKGSKSFQNRSATMKTAVTEYPSTSKSPTEFSKMKKLKITIMKSMKNFAAQQLSKKEMNNVKGGAQFDCTVSVDGEIISSGAALGNSKREVAEQLLSQYRQVYYEDERIEVRCR